MINDSTESINTQFQNRLFSIRQIMAEYSDAEEFSNSLLEELQRLFNLRDLQLTVYYDQPLALEVIHYRLRDNDFFSSSVTVAEEEDILATDTEEVLAPDKSIYSYPLTFRSRLVGLLMIGEKFDSSELSSDELDHIEMILPLVAVGVDNVSMIRQVRETQARLFESEKLASIGQLASGIAHEIRNPLSSVKMNLQGLSRNESLTERNRRRVTICLDAIDRLDHIIGEMMRLARRTRLEVKTTGAMKLIRQSVEMARAELKERNVEVNIDESLELSDIQVDESQITHALLNLILNAAQAIERDGTINIQAEQYGKGVEFIIEDNGPGIPEDLRRDIFNPFFTTKAIGTGLGLANVLKSVQEHGGELDFISKSGKGTTFYMRLPEKPPKRMDDPSALRVVPK